MSRLKRERFFVISFDKAMTEYLDDCNKRNLSEKSIHYYEYELNRFIKSIKIKDIKNLNQEVLDKYLEVVETEYSYNEISYNSLARVLNLFFAFIYKKDYVTTQLKIPYKKVTQKIKQLPTEKEVQRLLVAPQLSYCSYNDYMAFVVCSIIMGNGMRIGSIASLRKSDLNFKDHIIYVRQTKGRREQHVFMSKKLEKVLKEYLNVLDDDSDALFIGSDGKPLTGNAIAQAVTRYAKNRGVNGISPHKLRHFFARSYILNGGDVYSLSKVLFHKNLQTTEIYLSTLNVDNFKNSIEKYNVLDRL